MRNATPHGITLTELLITITIITALTAVLIPHLANANKLPLHNLPIHHNAYSLTCVGDGPNEALIQNLCEAALAHVSSGWECGHYTHQTNHNTYQHRETCLSPVAPDNYHQKPLPH